MQSRGLKAPRHTPFCTAGRQVWLLTQYSSVNFFTIISTKKRYQTKKTALVARPAGCGLHRWQNWPSIGANRGRRLPGEGLVVSRSGEMQAEKTSINDHKGNLFGLDKTTSVLYQTSILLTKVPNCFCAHDGTNPLSLNRMLWKSMMVVRTQHLTFQMQKSNNRERLN